MQGLFVPTEDAQLKQGESTMRPHESRHKTRLIFTEAAEISRAKRWHRNKCYEVFQPAIEIGLQYRADAQWHRMKQALLNVLGSWSPALNNTTVSPSHPIQALTSTSMKQAFTTLFMAFVCKSYSYMINTLQKKV